jgi:hypothetical protein
LASAGRNDRFFFVLPWIPLLLWILIFPFLPSFGAVVYRRVGPKWATATLGIPLALLAVLTESGAASGMWLLQWLAMGPLLMAALVRLKSLERAMAAALGGVLLLQGGLLLAVAVERGKAPWEVVRMGVEASVRRSLEAYAQMGAGPDTVAQLQTAAPALAHVLCTLVPGLVLALDLGLLWWTLLVARRISTLWGGGGGGADNLSAWAMPFPWVWATIAGGLLLLFPGETLPAIGINALMLMGMLHLFQGIGVMATVFRQRRVPHFLRGVLYALIFFQQFLLLGVVAVGLFDVWFDFRRRWAPKARA